MRKEFMPSTLSCLTFICLCEVIQKTCNLSHMRVRPTKSPAKTASNCNNSAKPQPNLTKQASFESSDSGLSNGVHPARFGWGLANLLRSEWSRQKYPTLWHIQPTPEHPNEHKKAKRMLTRARFELAQISLLQCSSTVVLQVFQT